MSRYPILPAQMQRYQPYYTLGKVTPLAHHLTVYYDRHCVARFTWDGTTLTKTSDWFGMYFVVANIVDDVPADMEHVRGLIDANIKAIPEKESAMSGGHIIHGIVYQGYYSEKRVNKIVILNHEVMPDDIPNRDSYRETKWEHVLESAVTIQFKPDGSATFGDSSVCVTTNEWIKPFQEVLDLFTTIDRSEIDKYWPYPEWVEPSGTPEERKLLLEATDRDRKARRTNMNRLGNICTDEASVLAALQLPLISVQAFNQAHGLQEEVEMSRFTGDSDTPIIGS